MIYRALECLAWLLCQIPGVRHALELDHSPSLNMIGECNCKSCVISNPHPRESWQAQWDRIFK